MGCLLGGLLCTTSSEWWRRGAERGGRPLWGWTRRGVDLKLLKIGVELTLLLAIGENTLAA